MEDLRRYANAIGLDLARFDQSGRFLDPNIDRQLRDLGQEVVRAARQFADDGVSEYAEAEGLLQE